MAFSFDLICMKDQRHCSIGEIGAVYRRAVIPLDHTTPHDRPEQRGRAAMQLLLAIGLRRYSWRAMEFSPFRR